MTPRQLILALLSAAFLLTGMGVASSVECAVCDRKLVDCRTPAQQKFVACMNNEKSGCTAKCSDNCKTQKDAQKCTISCVQSCQGTGSCRATFASATNSCTNEFQSCKKGCTGPR